MIVLFKKKGKKSIPIETFDTWRESIDWCKENVPNKLSNYESSRVYGWSYVYYKLYFIFIKPKLKDAKEN